MKSFLKVLAVGAVMALSLAVMQKSAQAEPMLASWYGPGLQGNYTASGEVFNMYDYTAASPYLPFGTELRVCYASCATVRVNDRGPYTGGRDLDLSYGAAQATGLSSAGVGYVDVSVLRYGYY